MSYFNQEMRGELLIFLASLWAVLVLFFMLTCALDMIREHYRKWKRERFIRNSSVNRSDIDLSTFI